MTSTVLAGIRVLCIDDDSFIRLTLKRILRSLGTLEFRDSADGNEALQLLNSEFRPDIVLCDVKMQPLDGPAFLRRLRALSDPGKARLPVILLTGTADDAVVNDTIGLDVASYLQKPVSSQQLAEAVCAALGRTSHS